MPVNEFNSLKKPTISACMIVRNEEKSLSSCLRSIKEHVDEIIIVDTGSTDGTVAIAESFGARVYHHPWEDHFSKHRNQSLSYARGEWLLIIDADEELQAENPDALRRVVLDGQDMDAVAVLVECPYGEKGARACHNSIRLFRNRREIFYKGRVHNYLVGLRRVLCTPMRILHHGYVLDRETQLRRFKRTTSLLKKDIEEDPANPRPRHFLAASYLSEHLNEEAAREAEKAIRLYGENPAEKHTCLWSLYIASSAYLEMGNLEKAGALARQGLDVHRDHLDSLYILAVVSYRGGDRERFHSYRARYMETRSLIEQNPSHFGEMVHNTYASAWLLHLFEACLCMAEGETRTAMEEIGKAETISPDPYTYHSTFGRLLLQEKRYLQASEHLQRGLEMRPQDTQLMWLFSYACEKTGKAEEQILLLQRLTALDPEFPDAHFQAGLALMRLGRYEAAKEYFRKACDLDPKNRLAIINQALCLRGMGRFEESINACRNVEPCTPDECRTLLLNQACCHDALRQDDLAIESFLELAQEFPETIEPPVYLSRLFLRKGEMESCVAQCDRLMKLLDIPRTIILQSLPELGELFSQSAFLLSDSLQRNDLSAICKEMSLLLGYSNKRRIPAPRIP